MKFHLATKQLSALVTMCSSAAIFCFLKEKQTRVYFTFQRCSFKKNMARDLNDDY